MKKNNSINKRSNSVRIIAGQWRGRKLPVATEPGLRPTIDRVREQLFNWLMYRIEGARVLDLFAGSGALGFECLSRGADHVDFIDRSKACVDLISKNIEILTCADRAKAYAMTSQQFLNSRHSGQYDLVFLDPPFADKLLPAAIQQLAQGSTLKREALVYMEFQSNEESPLLPENWDIYREGKAGNSRYLLCQIGPKSKTSEL